MKTSQKGAKKFDQTWARLGLTGQSGVHQTVSGAQAGQRPYRPLSGKSLGTRAKNN
jgi:hypothetical protein